MTIHITCNNSNCAKRVRVRDELAGRRIKCPVCGTVQGVPLPTTARVAAPAPQEPEPLQTLTEEPQPRESPKPIRRKRWPWIAGAGVIVLLIGAVVIWRLTKQGAEDDSDAATGALRASKVIRARRGLLGDGRKLNVHFPDRDVALILKVKGVPPAARVSGMDLMLKSYVMIDNERREFNYLSGIEKNSPLWLGTIIPSSARSVMLHLHGLEPLKIELPTSLVDEAKLYD